MALVAMMIFVLMVVDRYIRIKDPLQYTQWITRRYKSHSSETFSFDKKIHKLLLGWLVWIIIGGFPAVFAIRSVPVLVGLVWITSALISFLPIMLDLHSPRYSCISLLLPIISTVRCSISHQGRDALPFPAPLARIVWGNFLGRNLLLLLGGVNPCQDALGHLFRDEVPD